MLVACIRWDARLQRDYVLFMLVACIRLGARLRRDYMCIGVAWCDDARALW